MTGPPVKKRRPAMASHRPQQSFFSQSMQDNDKLMLRLDRFLCKPGGVGP